MSFTHSNNIHNSATSGTTVSVSPSSWALAAGDIIVASLAGFSGLTLSTVKDTTNNITWTITPHSGTGSTWIAYWVVTLSGTASFTVQCTFTGTIGGASLWLDYFSVTGNSPTLDTDIAGTGTTGTAINTPTVSPAGSTELLVGVANPGSSISTVNSPWTIGGGGIIDGVTAAATGYILSASSPTAMNMTQSSSGSWDSIIAAFTQSGGGGGGGPTVPQLMSPNNMGSSLIVIPKPIIIGY